MDDQIVFITHAKMPSLQLHTRDAVCWAGADRSADCVFGCFHGDPNGRRHHLALQLSRHVCLLYSLVVLPNALSDVQQPAIQNEMPHRLWILFIWELGDALFPGVSEQAFTAHHSDTLWKRCNSHCMWKYGRWLWPPGCRCVFFSASQPACHECNWFHDREAAGRGRSWYCAAVVAGPGAQRLTQSVWGLWHKTQDSCFHMGAETIHRAFVLRWCCSRPEHRTTSPLLIPLAESGGGCCFPALGS